MMLCELHPEHRERRAEIYAHSQKLLDEGLAFRRADANKDGLITIQVVVHVVYKDPAHNISDAQIKSQLKVLNEDYRAKNTDRKKVPACWQSLIADARIEFVLASKDPKGKPTSGITRTQTTVDTFRSDDTVKSSKTGGADPWPSKKYLNLWVCALGDGLLGYAQFPGMPEKTDGVVILNTAFGTTGITEAPFNKGRTATHEIGHWLNLNHIWGDQNNCTGSDHVNDTPNAKLPNFGKPKFPHISCGNAPNGDMFVNYMDYVDDDAMHMFTPGQVARMHATLSGPRASVGA